MSKKAGLPPGTLVGDDVKSAAPVKITVIDYDENSYEEKELEAITDCRLLREKPTVTWVNVDGLHGVDVLEELGECFGLHPLVLEDIANTDQRPKTEDYGEYLFVVLKILDYAGDEVGTEQVSLILGPNYVLSFQERAGDVFDAVRERLRNSKGRIRKTGPDYLAYALLDAVDGFILKSRSPTSGLKDVKIYPAAAKTAPSGKGAGFFGAAVLARFGHLAVEDEGRLKNLRLREHFLTKLYALASLREAKHSGRAKDLVQFHAENKFLLMAYNQTRMRALGRVVAGAGLGRVAEAVAAYEDDFYAALARPPRYTANINVLMHGLGHFSKELSHAEKAFFLDELESYRAGHVPLSVPLNVLRGYVVRFGDEYLANQTFFLPYPEEVTTLADSGKGLN